MRRVEALDEDRLSSLVTTGRSSSSDLTAAVTGVGGSLVVLAFREEGLRLGTGGTGPANAGTLTALASA